MAVLLVVLMLLQCGRPATNQIPSSFGWGHAGSADPTEYRNAIWRAYDADKSFEENFYSLLGDICPESVYCQSTLTSTTNNSEYQDNVSDARELVRNISHSLTGCCEPCSCDADDCMERQSCCPAVEMDMAQSPGAKTETNMTQECVIASLNSYKYPNSAFQLGPLDISYYMVTDCFSVNNNEEALYKCRNPDIEKPAETTPVYSPSSKKNFKNVFCAECNGENDTVAWLLFVNFNNLVTLTDKYKVTSIPQEIYDNHVLRRRHKLSELVFVPPQEMHSSQKNYYCTLHTENFNNICEQKLLKNENDDDDEDDDDDDDDGNDFFIRACAMGKHAYHKSIGWFGNVFCYLCQSVISNKQNSRCTIDFNNRFSGESFSALLIIPKAQFQAKDASDNQSPCKCTEYHDEKRNICRQLICPPGWTYVQCRCVEFLTDVTGMSVQLYLDISIEHYTDDVIEKLGDSVEDHTATRLVAKAEKLLKSRWGPMDSYLMAIYRETSHYKMPSLKLYTAYNLVFKGQIDNRKLIQEIFEALDVGITLKVTNFPVKLTLGRVRPLSFGNDSYSLVFGRNNQSENMSLVHKLFLQNLLRKRKNDLQLVSKLVYCQRIKLEDEEVTLLQNNASTLGFQGSRIRYVLQEIDGSICLDEFERSPYFGRSKVSYSIGSGNTFAWLLWLCVVTFSYSYL